MHTGKLLVATPSIISDFNFQRAVIFLVRHDDSGSFGFIVNKQANVKLNDFVEDLAISVPLYFGGPVDEERLFFIHNVPEVSGKSINEGLFYGGDYEALLAKLNHGEISNENVRFFLGYSGWDQGQLEAEIQTHSWEVCDNAYGEGIIADNDKIWKEQMTALGGKYLLWSNAPQDPDLN